MTLTNDPWFYIESARKVLAAEYRDKKQALLLCHLIEREELPPAVIARELAEYFLRNGRCIGLRRQLEEIADSVD